MTPYRTQALDTTSSAELYLFNLWRSWGLLKKISCLNHSTYSTRKTAWYFAQSQSGLLNKHQQIAYFLQKIGEFPPLSATPHLSPNLTMLGVIEEALVVIKVLESLGIPYCIGGSVASGIWGELRYTQDLDLIADLNRDHIHDLVKAFSPRFYLSDQAILDAIEHRQSFNLIDNETGWKIDIFILALDPFHQNQFQRKQKLTVDEHNHSLWIASAEDTILQKILWHRLSQRQSQQQWRDILGMLKLQNDRLEISYLKHWANFLDIGRDLEQAFIEAGY